MDRRLYNSRITKAYVDYLARYRPQYDVDSALERAGISRFELEDPAHWFTQEQVDRLQDILARETGVPNLPREAGRYGARSPGMGAARRYTLGLLNPASVYLLVGKVAALLSRGARIKARRLESRRIEITAAPNPGVHERQGTHRGAETDASGGGRRFVHPGVRRAPPPESPCVARRCGRRSAHASRGPLRPARAARGPGRCLRPHDLRAKPRGSARGSPPIHQQTAHPERSQGPGGGGLPHRRRHRECTRVPAARGQRAELPGAGAGGQQCHPSHGPERPDHVLQPVRGRALRVFCGGGPRPAPGRHPPAGHPGGGRDRSGHAPALPAGGPPPRSR